MNYKQAQHREMFGELGSVGVKILVGEDVEITEELDNILYKAAEAINKAVLKKLILNSPRAQARTVENRRSLLALFTAPIFVEEIPNGYCSDYCCTHLPWFVVTTSKGRITIGWRKHVIEIKWEDSVSGQAYDLFPKENVTKGDRYIHAWGYDKAQEYVNVLLAPPAPANVQRAGTDTKKA